MRRSLIIFLSGLCATNAVANELFMATIPVEPSATLGSIAEGDLTARLWTNHASGIEDVVGDFDVIEVIGTTPFANVIVPVTRKKTVTLKIRLDGYKEQSRKVTLKPGAVADVSARLVEKPKFGTISIFSEPWAHIYFRGRKIGTAPQRGIKLPIGRHRRRIRGIQAFI